MQPVNKNHQTFNDGVLFLGKIEPIYDSANKKTGETFNEYQKMYFANMTKREQDFNFANSIGASLDLKVKILKFKVSTKNKAKINDVLYDIFKYDEDEFYTYLYLQVINNE